MKLLVGCVALLAAAIVVPRAEAAKCTDTSVISSALESTVSTCSCASLKHGKFVQCVKKALKTFSGDKSCKKAAVKAAQQSLCGKPNAVVCCQATKKSTGSVKKNANKCKKGNVCQQTNRDSVLNASPLFQCTASGECVTTTTTTTSTTSTSTTTTTLIDCSQTPCTAADPTLTFTVASSTDNCGMTQDGTGTKLKDLRCGDLILGGGKGTTPAGGTPAGSESIFRLHCEGNDCTMCPTSPSGAFITQSNCTDTGCYFGTPLPILGGVSTCVVNVLSAPACGTFDQSTGATNYLSIALTSNTHLTGDFFYGFGPCPQCTTPAEPGDPNAVDGVIPVVGSPDSPQTGTCHGGKQDGQACTSSNPNGLTQDCQPDDNNLIAQLPVDLTPLTTGTATKTDPNGLFCPGQNDSADPAEFGKAGCFGGLDGQCSTTKTTACERSSDCPDGETCDFSTAGTIGPNCRTISLTGQPAGPLTVGTPAPARLASVFCIPGLTSGDFAAIVNSQADLPGPGATSLPGTLLLQNPAP
jgi:hypothetical protein